MTSPDAPATYGGREAQPLQKMLEFVGSQGWDFFKNRMEDDGRDRASTLEAERMRLVASDFKIVFGSEAGTRVLDYLADITVRRPLWFLGTPDGYAAMREGQNALFYTMLKILASAREENPPQREGHTNVGS